MKKQAYIGEFTIKIALNMPEGYSATAEELDETAEHFFQSLEDALISGTADMEEASDLMKREEAVVMDANMKQMWYPEDIKRKAKL